MNVAPILEDAEKMLILEPFNPVDHQGHFLNGSKDALTIWDMPKESKEQSAAATSKASKRESGGASPRGRLSKEEAIDKQVERL